MPAPSAPQVNTVILQTADGNNLVSCPLIAGATSYSVQRSTDGVTWTTVGSPTTPSYLDANVTPGTLYYYQMAAVNGSGTSAYTLTSPISCVPALPGQVSLLSLRYEATLKADMLNSQFLTADEWNIRINKSLFKLFDLLITKFGEDYAVASPYTILTTGASSYSLPDGSSAFAVGGVTPPACYKLLGVDCGVAVSENAWVTLPRFNWIDRNRFIYPQLGGNALGVLNLSYRQMGNQLRFIPNPAAGQNIQIWYIPVMSKLLRDTDIFGFSLSGWDEYVTDDAAIGALIKEESYEQANELKENLSRTEARIESAAANRDAGQPNTISDTRSNTGWFDGPGYGGGFGMGGM